MTEEMVMIPKRVLKMVTQDGFIDFFYSIKKSYMTKVDAYEMCEEIHEQYFGKRKYSEFQTFNVILSRRNKK